MHNPVSNLIKASVVTGIVTGITACGGGGYGGGSGNGGGGGGGGAPTYTVGGSVAGLSGTGLKLRNNTEDLAINANGAFTFPTALTAGAAYNVTVVTQPTGPSQQCGVVNSSGSIGTSNVTNVTITCSNLPLSLISATPTPGAQNASRAVPLTMTFSTTLDVATAIESNVSLRLSNESHPVSVSASANKLTVTPSRALLPLSVYTLQASPALRGSAGETLSAPVSNTFVTGDGEWKPRQFISVDKSVSVSPQTAFDANGNGIAVWLDRSLGIFSVWASRYTPGHGWSAPELIENEDLGHAQLPQVAFDAAGDAIAIWTQDNGKRAVVRANRFTPTGGWGNAVSVESNPSDTADAANPRVAFEPNGDALAVWEQSDGTRLNVWSNRYTNGPGWGTPQLLENEDLGDAHDPQIVADASGNAIAAWIQADTQSLNFMWARYAPANGWSAATKLDTPATGAISRSSIAMEPRGTAFAVYAQFDQASSLDIWSSQYTAASGWSTPVRVETATKAAGNPRVALDAHGHAMAVWTQFDGTRYGIWANRWTGDHWGTAEPIEQSPTGSDLPLIVLDPAGNAIAAWTRDDLGHTDIWVNRYSPDAGWGTAQALEADPANSALEPALSVDSSGNALITWYQSDGTSSRIVGRRFE
jgi:hypothetical protein